MKRWEFGDHWVEIDIDLCADHESCVNICPVNVFKIVNEKVNADNIGDCIDCNACLDICPTNAILSHSAWE